MKLPLLSFLSLIIFFSASALAQKGGYSIKGKVHGVKDTVIQLGNYYGDKQYLKDSAMVDGQGKFVFEGKEKLEGGIYLVIMPDRKYFEIIINSQQDFSLETDTSDYIKNMKIKNSPENVLFYNYLNYVGPKGKEAESLKTKLEEAKEDTAVYASIRTQLLDIDKDVINFQKEIIAGNPGTFVSKLFLAMQDIDIPDAPLLENGAKDSLFAFKYYREHFWDNIDFSDDRILRSPVYHKKLKKYIENLTIQIPDSINQAADYILEKARTSPELFKYTLWYITNTYERSQIMGMDAVFVYLVEKYYVTKQAFWVDEEILEKIVNRAKTLKPLLIGNIAPDLILRDLNHNTVQLHQVKAKYTILYFWDPDCGHCKKVTPEVNDIYRKNKAKGVETYAVAVTTDLDKMKKFIEEKELKWINVYEPQNPVNLKKTYDIYSTPIIYLLDEKKKIIAKKISHEQLEEIIGKEFEKPQDEIK